MKNFDVYFEIYGKKLKTTVLAENEERAKEIVRNKIIFHKVAKNTTDTFNQVTDMLDDMNNMFGTKK